MDDLNSQQIVLLTLLVSFVTSIATGITTVSLLEQAPDPVTQTINRVVERTVERVITEPSTDSEKVIEKEIVTVVVNQEDLTIEAVEKNAKSLMRIYSVAGDLKTFVGLGLIFNDKGDVVTDSSIIKTNEQYVGTYYDGERKLVVGNKNENFPFVSLSIDPGTTTQSIFTSAKLSDSENLRLGQTVISVSGENKNTVSTGIINSLEKNTEETELLKIMASVDGNNVLLGSVILNLKGEIVGFRISDSVTKTSFIPVNMVKKFLLEGDLSLGQTEIVAEAQ
jgi:hypothetical protein